MNNIEKMRLYFNQAKIRYPILDNIIFEVYYTEAHKSSTIFQWGSNILIDTVIVYLSRNATEFEVFSEVVNIVSRLVNKIPEIVEEELRKCVG